MTAQPPRTRLDALCVLLQKYYRLHLWTFVAGNVLLTAINVAGGAPWWALWPLLIWGIPFSIHFFIFKSLTVTEEWADERIDDLRWRSYDLGHVEDLEDRIRADDFSTRPAHRRDPDWWQHPKHGEGQDVGHNEGQDVGHDVDHSADVSPDNNAGHGNNGKDGNDQPSR